MSAQKPPLPPNPVIFFDGVCNLCNASVDFLIRHDTNRLLRYASLQSSAGQQALLQAGLSADAYESFLLFDNGKFYTRSTAALRTAIILGGFFRLLAIFFVVPRPIRDVIYSFVARNRYRWFGQKETCRLPTPEERALFIS
jgi:predicted DCC family thiol-disulfide oxidoreductase YuxK